MKLEAIETHERVERSRGAVPEHVELCASAALAAPPIQAALEQSPSKSLPAEIRAHVDAGNVEQPLWLEDRVGKHDPAPQQRRKFIAAVHHEEEGFVISDILPKFTFERAPYGRITSHRIVAKLGHLLDHLPHQEGEPWAVLLCGIAHVHWPKLQPALNTPQHRTAGAIKPDDQPFDLTAGFASSRSTARPLAAGGLMRWVERGEDP